MRVLAALLSWLMLALPAFADVAVVGTPSSQNTGGATSATLTFAHDSGTGSDRIIVVGVAIRTSIPSFTVTYAGQALTPLIAENHDTLGVGCALLYRVAPSTGSNTVVVTNSDAQAITAGAVSFSGVNQSSPFGDTDSTEVDEGTSITRTLTSAVGDLVIDVVAMGRSDEGSFVVGAPPQTEQWANVTTISPAVANNVRGASSTEIGAASVTVSWSWSSAADVVQCAASVTATGGAVVQEALQPILQ